MKKLNFHAGIATPAAIAIIVLLAAAGTGVYFLGKSRGVQAPVPLPPEPTTQNQQNQNQTGNQSANNGIPANWKTYTSAECGYSFQYPDSWSQLGNELNAIDRNGVIMSRSIDFMDIASQGIELSDGNNNQIAAAKDHMHVACNTMGTAVYNDELSRYNNSSDIFAQNKRMIIVDGQQAIVGEQRNTATVSSGAHPGRTIIPDRRMYVFFLHKDGTRALYFEFDTPLGGNDNVEVAKFNQVLSSFKFISLDNAQANITYNDPFGFSFSHPSSWVMNTDSNGVISLQTQNAYNPITITKQTGKGTQSSGKWGPMQISHDGTQWVRQNAMHDASGLTDPFPATPEAYTDSGLPIFAGATNGHGWGMYGYIVALSPTKYLAIYGPDEMSDDPAINPTLRFAKSIKAQ